VNEQLWPLSLVGKQTMHSHFVVVLFQLQIYALQAIFEQKIKAIQCASDEDNLLSSSVLYTG